jgi:hypothetical protein
MAVIQAIRIVPGGLMVMALALLVANRDGSYRFPDGLHFQILSPIVIAILAGCQFVGASLWIEDQAERGNWRSGRSS